MKKAKILIPSLSLLCLSAVACVTGTVAWFSSVSNAQVATSNFAVKALEGSMNISVYHGVGTKATLASATEEQTIKDGSGNIIGYKNSQDIVVAPDKYDSDTKSNELTHASFDTANQTPYTIKPYSGATPEYDVVSTKSITKANESNFWCNNTEGVYHIFSFDLTFTYNFNGATSGKYNLFFDLDSTAAKVDGSDPLDLDTAKAFRMGFYNLDTKDWVVWSKLQGATYDGGAVTSKYVSSTTATTAYKSTDDGNLIYKGDTLSPITGATGSAARKDCLGTFDASTPTSEIKLRVVAWYEGDDPNIDSQAEMSAINTTVKFFLKGYAA